MNIACPVCDTVYRIDPANVPDHGARTRCSRCGAPFLVTVEPEANRPGVTVPAQPASDAPSPPARGKSAAAEQPEQPEQPEQLEQLEHLEQLEQPERAVQPAGGQARAPGSTAGSRPPPSGEGRPAGGQAPAVPVFGPQDPQTRARRLARALISDIKVYNRDRWDQSRSAGTLRKDFRDEILKSWEEYVEQVGDSMAKQSPYFRDALNDILAAGERVF